MTKISNKPRYWALIPAAGIGNRFDSTVPKQYFQIQGRSVLEHTLDRFVSHPLIEQVIVILAENDTYWPHLPYRESLHPKITTTYGGVERVHSVLNGLHYLKSFASPQDWVLVHDAVRPCLHPQDVTKLIEQLKDHPVGGLLAIPVKDTMKRANENLQIVATVPRVDLWHALTPQMFRYDLLYAALQSVVDNNHSVTDEAAAVEYSGATPLLIEGRRDNIKLTYQEDIALLEMYLAGSANTNSGVRFPCNDLKEKAVVLDSFG